MSLQSRFVRPFAILLIAVLSACGDNQSSPQLPATGVQPPSHNAEQWKIRASKNRVRYILEDMGTFGGPHSFIIESEQWLLPSGILTGIANTSTPDPYAPNCFDQWGTCYVDHAFLWKEGTLHDLGTLPNGASSETNWINAREDTAGTSQNGVSDPIYGQQDRAVLGRDGQIENLGTLGGTFSGATGIDDAGAVTGIATNTIYDPNPMLPNSGSDEVRAFLWKDGHMRDLGTLGGADAFGQIINSRGQVAGFSYTGASGSSGPVVDPFLWSPSGHRQMLDLGGFGGTFGAVGWLNDRGEVVGASNGSGDQSSYPFLWRNGKLKNLGTFGGTFGTATWINEAGITVGWAAESDNATIHAAVWKNGTIKDLGSLPGDDCAFGYGINSRGQIVGTTFAMPGACSWPSRYETDMNAVLWQNGSILNLNDAVASGSSLNLVIAFDVDDTGDIAGVGVPPGVPVGDLQLKGHAFVLIPCDKLRNPKPCGDAVPLRVAASHGSRPFVRMSRPFTAMTGMAAIRAQLARYFHFAAFRNLSLQPLRP